jgi:hypothetical protein
MGHAALSEVTAMIASEIYLRREQRICSMLLNQVTKPGPPLGQ